MYINFKNSEVYIECLLITLFATAGSFYYFLSGYSKLVLIILWGIIMLKNVIIKREAYFPISLLLVLSMIVISVRNNSYLESIYTLPTVLLFIDALMFSFLASYQNNDWYQKSIKLMIIPYFIYSAYTIAMHFIPQLIYVSYSIFQNNDMLLQFTRGGLPGLTNHYSTNAVLIANGLMIGACFLTVYRKNYLALIYTVVALLALLWTGKRAHIIFTVFAVIIGDYVYLSDNKNLRRKHMIAIALGILISLAVIITFIPSLALFIDRFESSAESGDVTLGRSEMWALAWEQFKTHPIIGVGWNQFRLINPMEWDAHNVYLQLLCETGMIGFTVYLIFFGYCLFITYRLVKHEKKRLRLTRSDQVKKKITLLLIAFSNQIFFVIYCFTGNPLYLKECYIPYFIACAFALAEYRKVKDEISTNLSTEIME